MHRKTRIFLATGFAALIGAGALTGLAHADRGTGGWGGHGKHGMGGMLAGMTERYDANKDGKLSQDEIDSNRTEWHARFDTEKDNALSLKEFEALWLEAQRERMVREFQRFDKDGDARVTLEEYKAPLAHIVENMDRNGDKFLSRDDRRRGQKREDAPKQE